MISLPIKPSSAFWVVNEHTSTAKETQILVVTALAGACIFALTVSLMAHLELVVGINATTQWAFTGTGVVLGCSALVVGLGCSPAVEPSIPLNDHKALKGYLKTLCAELAKTEGDPLEVLQKCAGYIPIEMLQEASEVKDALQLATHMLRQANFYHKARGSLSPSTQARLERMRDTLVSILDTLLMVFGVADFFKPSESAIHADFKFQKIMMLISLFTLLTATLLPLLGVATGASIVGGVMLLIAVLSVIWPRIRPSTSSLPSAENWSAQIQSGAMAPSSGRQGTTSEIYQALKGKSHVLLTGPSGIGKTQTAQAFTQRLVQGEFPELAGKKVFYFNAAELVSSADMFSHQNSILKRIEEAMGSNREDYILIIDEIHVAFEKHENNPFGDKFKTFLDNVPYVIGLTTDEEYAEHILTVKGTAGARRFDTKISVKSTGEADTQAILNHFLVSTAPHALVAPGALKELIEKTKNKPQPLSAMGILNKCLTCVTQTESTPTFISAEEKRATLEFMTSQGIVLGAASALEEEDTTFAEMERLEMELKALEQTCAQEAGELDTLTLTRKRLADVREVKWKLVTEIETSGGTQGELNQLMLLKGYLEPALEMRIKEIAAQLKIPVVIDQALVRAVIEQQEKNLSERAEILAQVKAKAG